MAHSVEQVPVTAVQMLPEQAYPLVFLRQLPQAPAQIVRVADSAQFLVAAVFVDEQRYFTRDIHGKPIEQFGAFSAALAGGAVGQLEQVQAAMQVQHRVPSLPVRRTSK